MGTKGAFLTMADIFTQQLMQIRGCGPSRAAALRTRYATWTALQQDLRRFEPAQRVTHLAALQCPATLSEGGASVTAERQKTIGKSVAQNIIDILYDA